MLTGPPSRFRIVVTAIVTGFAVFLELTGPPGPFLFGLRLPVLVLLIGAAWTWSPDWTSVEPGGVDRSRQSVPMASPVLLMTSTGGVAAGTVKLVSVSPALACAVFSVVSAACCLVVGLVVTGGRFTRLRRDAAPP